MAAAGSLLARGTFVGETVEFKGAQVRATRVADGMLWSLDVFLRSTECIREICDRIRGFGPVTQYIRVDIESSRPLGHLDLLGKALPRATVNVHASGHADDLCAMLRALTFQPDDLRLYGRKGPSNILRAAALALELFADLRDLDVFVDPSDVQYTTDQAAGIGAMIAEHRNLTNLGFTDKGNRVPAKALYSTLRAWPDGTLRVEEQTPAHRAALCRVLPRACWKCLTTEYLPEVASAVRESTLKEYVMTNVESNSAVEAHLSDDWERAGLDIYGEA